MSESERESARAHERGNCCTIARSATQHTHARMPRCAAARERAQSLHLSFYCPSQMNEKSTDRAKSLKCTLQQNVCGLESGLCVRAMKAVDDAANVTASVDTPLMEENMNTMMGRIKQLEEHATIIQKTWRMFSAKNNLLFCPLYHIDLDLKCDDGYHKHSIFCWELTVPTSKAKEVKEVHLHDYDLKFVQITVDGDSTHFAMTLCESAHQDEMNYLHEHGWMEDGDYDYDTDDFNNNYDDLPIKIKLKVIDSDGKRAWLNKAIAAATMIQKTWRMFSGAKVWRCNDALSEKDTTEGDSSSKEASPSEYSDSSASSSESSDDEFDVDELDQAAAADHYEGMAMRTRGAVALALVVVLAVAVALARQSKP